MEEPIFLTLAEVVEIHADQIARYGGDPHIRDINALESAVAQAESAFGGEFLHKDLFEMAAAYAFHICQNHPCVDGNKRTALATALVFLEINEISLHDPKQMLLSATLSMANGKLRKKEFANILRDLAGN